MRNTRKIVAIAFKPSWRWARLRATGSSQDTKQKEKRLVAGEVEAKRLLLLMDRDQEREGLEAGVHGFYGKKSSKKLDINRDGELDVQELTQTRLVPHTGTHR